VGLLDDVARDLSEVLIDALSDEVVTMQRTRRQYEPTSGTDVSFIELEVSVKASPPFPFSKRYVDGVTVLGTDKRMIVAAKVLDELGFDPVPASDVQVVVQARGEVFHVREATPYSSGDQEAAYELHLRT
jgi:hypothetical protein